MDVDLECVEIIFAQKLASGEPPVRARALRELQKWIEQQSQTKPFKEGDMLRLCKGLHYVMWMQDKMIIQEELADRISGLLNTFKSEDEKTLYFMCLFRILSDEWPNIDKWRMDKFLMLLRRILRVVFAHLRSQSWNNSTLKKYLNTFMNSAVSGDVRFNEGLKFHFASVYLDELDFAGGISKMQVIDCLLPFISLLGSTDTSNYLFDSVLDEIFVTILHQVSENLAAGQVDAQDAAQMMNEESSSIEFDYSAIAKLLFDTGKRSNVKASRRSRLYGLSKKFEIAASGCDPFKEKNRNVEGGVLSKEDVDNGVVILQRMHAERQEDRIAHAKEKRKAKQRVFSEQLSTASEFNETRKQKSKTKKLASKGRTSRKHIASSKNKRGVKA